MRLNESSSRSPDDALNALKLGSAGRSNRLHMREASHSAGAFPEHEHEPVHMRLLFSILWLPQYAFCTAHIAFTSRNRRV